MAARMHENELDIDEALVRRLLHGQFPRWANLPLQELPRAGTDNALFRLGEEMVVRLPRIDWAAGQAEKDHRWLSRLAPHLPLAIPVPVALGEAGETYPWRWSICPWLPGENPTRENVTDLDQAALDVAGFVRAMWRIDTAGGPGPGRKNAGRGGPLATRDDMVRRSLPEWETEFDGRALRAIWDEALAAAEWDAAPVWVHGDLHPGNMLTCEGRICAVIDFGTLGVGDPAVEMIFAWYFLDRRSRAIYRKALDLDEAAWARGRGWAVSMALGTLPYYRDTNPGILAMARRALRQLLEDSGRPVAGA